MLVVDYVIDGEACGTGVALRRRANRALAVSRVGIVVVETAVVVKVHGHLISKASKWLNQDEALCGNGIALAFMLVVKHRLGEVHTCV